MGINHKRQGSRIYYWPMFMLRRVMFVTVPILMFAFPILQLQFLCFFTSLYIIVVVYIRPHTDNNVLRLEIFNEVMLMMSCYHMFCFTEFNVDDLMKYSMGHSYVFFVTITFFINVINMIVKNTERYKRKMRMEKMRANFNANKEEIMRKEHV